MGRIYDLFVSKYNYTDFHELNLDWLIAAIKQMEYEVENFVSINAVKYADPIQWDITRQYEKNTIVIDAITGTAYISRKPVPMGVALSNADYWNVVFDLGRFITLTAQNFADSYEPVTTTTATVPTSEGGWLVWNSILYQALNDIHVGDMYVENGNIVQRTVEYFFNLLASGLSQEIQDRQDEDSRIELSLTGLINSKVGIEAQARADEDTRIELSLTNLINSKVGIEAQTRADEDARIQLELSDLITSKISIAETTLRSEMVSIYDISKHGAVADGVTDNTAIIQAGIDSGMAVYIPQGIWATNQIELKYGTKIFGCSDGYAGAKGSTLKALHNTGSIIHVNSGVHKVIIKDLGLDGSGINTSCPNGIEINHDVSDYLIEHVYVKRAKIGIYLGSTGWATVRDCFVENCYSDGFKMENNMDSRPLQINFINCLSEKNDGNGYRFINNQGSVAPAGTMINCATFANSGRGVIYYGGFSAIRMTNCFFGSDGNNELELNGNNGEYPATIANCQFEMAGLETTGVDKATAASHAGYGLVLTAGSSANVTNVLITSNSGAGVLISNSRSAISNSFIGNNAQFLGGTELLTDQPSRLFMSNNTIKSNKAYGLYFSNATDVACIVGNLYANYTSSANYIATGNNTVHVINNVDKNGQLLA